ncbi:MAG: sigma-54-dependent Fis family transcriptional regulator [Phycisphaeraceae bacterium]|nr:sigma-54-dependent Fis family transcriptional regulator [Phycisphaeraceae bacterium]
MTTVLVVDDKEMLRDSVGTTLQRAGFTVLAACDGAAALEMIARRKPDAVVTDLKMPNMTGVELLSNIRAFDADLPVVLMTAYGTVETAVEAMSLGAFTYITKPFEGDELLIAVKRAIEHGRLKRENAVLRLTSGAAEDSTISGDEQPLRGVDRLIGESDAMRRVREQIGAIAASHGSALIAGESGVGKEVVARAIHEMSERRGEAFLAVNCAALSESLLESELFGHEKGAFTGADQLRKGRFELADRGTLLLDEVSEVRPQIQAKLLRVLQERTLERVGSSMSIGVDVRVIATTNRDLPLEVDEGRFRGDLYYRLNVLPIHIPPLRERMEDVPVLADHFLRAVCRRDGRAMRDLSDDALRALLSYSWPGNVRELQNICERAVVLSRGEGVDAELIRGWLTQAAPAPGVVTRPMTVADRHAHAGGYTNGHANGHANGSAALATMTRPAEHVAIAPELEEHSPIICKETRLLDDIERQAIVETLLRFNGHRQKTAKALGIGVRTLGLKLKKWKEDNLVSASL